MYKHKYLKYKKKYLLLKQSGGHTITNGVLTQINISSNRYTLDLSNENITSIADGVFYTCSHITELNLSVNKLTSLGPDVFTWYP